MSSPRLLTALVLTSLALPSAAAAQDKEPTYRGHTVREWALRIGLQEDDVGDRAVRAFQKLGPRARSAVPALIQILVWYHDHTPAGGFKVQNRAVAALKAIGPDAVPALRSALKGEFGAGTEPSNTILFAIKTLQALGELGVVAVPFLIGALKEMDLVKRTAVIQALGRIGPPAKSAIPALRKIVESRDVNFWLVAGVALRQIDPAAAKMAGVPK